MKLSELTQINGKLAEKSPETKENPPECKHDRGWTSPNGNGLISCKLCGKTKHPSE